MTTKTLLLAALMLCSGCVTTPVTQPHELTIVTLNAASGFDPRYRTAAAHAAQRAFLDALHPDVVSLQEAMGDLREVFPRGGRIFSASEGTLDGQTIGNALWVRDGLAMGESWSIPLSSADAWPRNAIFAYVEGKLIAATHLSVGDINPARDQQVLDILDQAPNVVAGDMNAPSSSFAPLMLPMLLSADGGIDQIWVYNHFMPGHSVATGGENALVSDHPCAAVTTLSLEN